MTDTKERDSIPDSTRLILTDAQVDEKSGMWMDAIGKRRQAVCEVLSRAEPVPTPLAVDPTDALEALGEIHQPSKRAHDYLRRFWRHFRDIRFTARKVVEIGVQTPKSINMWEEFFPNATIYGIDIESSCSAFAGGRKKIFIGDQMDQNFLMNFIKETGGDFDVVIDDGLHTSYSMLRSFSYLYPALHSHGIYVIEDIIRQPEVLRFVHGLGDCANFYPASASLRDWPSLSSFGDAAPWLVRNTVAVSIYRYIAFIERGFNPRDNRFFLTPEELAARNVQGKDTVAATAEDLKRKGIAPTRENLIEILGVNFAMYIEPYLQENSKR